MRGSSMVDVSRRTLLVGASGAAVGTALGAGMLDGSPARAGGAADAGARLTERVVRDADMVWRRPPTSWQTAPFLGNGFLGVQVYQAPEGNVLKFMLSHSEVQDQRAQWEAAIGLSRLPIG